MTTTTTASKPVLQIVHISDLHFHVGPAPQNDGLVKRVISLIAGVNARFGRWLLDYWEDGRAGHATDALIAFECFLTGKPMPHEPANTFYPTGLAALSCNDIPTWLVDTGDLASVGDDASIRAEIAWVDRMAALLGDGDPIRLYGNHDAWPNKFPAIASKATLATHRTNLRKNFFPGAHPLYPRSIPIGSTGNRIDLYRVNSVIHDRWPNTRALGQLRKDPHWGGAGAKDQLPELAKLVAQKAKQQAGRAFRILLSHHPVHYPPPPPKGVMTLQGAATVGKQLINSTGGATGPLAHLVLSGHTHNLYPGHGTLPPNAGTTRHPPLGLQQLQLVVGSLSKAIRYAAGGSYVVDAEPHQFQVLRFFDLPGYPDSLVMKRTVIGRNNGSGRFAFMPVDPSGEVWETSILNF
jgi:predicted MPP superfamily phosphohydrolase